MNHSLFFSRWLARPEFVAMFVTAAALGGSNLAMAYEWQIASGVELATIYSRSDTDNNIPADPDAVVDGVDGALADGDGGSTVLRLAPYVRLNGNGRRSSLSLQAGVSLQEFIEQDRTEINPSLALSSRQSLLTDTAWFDLSGRVSQRFVNANAQVGDPDLQPDAAAEVYELRGGPAFQRVVSDRAILRGGYNFALSRSGDDDVAGGTTHAIGLDGIGLLTETGMLALFRTQHQLTDFENLDSVYLGIALGGIGYPINPRLFGRVYGGQDWTRFDDDEEVETSEIWGLGVRWTPRTDITLNAEYGWRVYGSAPRLQLTIEGRRSQIDLSWSRGLSVASGFDNAAAFTPDTPLELTDEQEDLTPVEQARQDSEGVFVDDAALAPIGNDADSVDERVTALFSRFGRRSTSSIGLSWIQRESFAAAVGDDGADTDTDTQAVALDLGYTRLITQSLTFNASYSHEQESLNGTNLDTRTRDNRLRLSIVMLF